MLSSFIDPSGIVSNRPARLSENSTPLGDQSFLQMATLAYYFRLGTTPFCQLNPTLDTCNEHRSCRFLRHILGS